MLIDKQQIVDMFKERGAQDKADRAQADLPEQVDTDQHSDLLDTLGVKDLFGGGVAEKLGF